MSVNIKYKNNSIATLTDTGTKTLKTSGKYCEADIIVENTKDGGGGYAAEAHAVTFTADLTCAKGSAVELCDTAIQTPLALGMITYSDGTTDDVHLPVVALGVGYALSGIPGASGYACSTSSKDYGDDSKGYVRLYSRQSGAFNSQFQNGLFVKNGKLMWNNKYGIGAFGKTAANFRAGVTYIFFIMG